MYQQRWGGMFGSMKPLQPPMEHPSKNLQTSLNQLVINPLNPLIWKLQYDLIIQPDSMTSVTLLCRHFYSHIWTKWHDEGRKRVKWRSETDLKWLIKRFKRWLSDRVRRFTCFRRGRRTGSFVVETEKQRLYLDLTRRNEKKEPLRK